MSQINHNKFIEPTHQFREFRPETTVAEATLASVQRERDFWASWWEVHQGQKGGISLGIYLEGIADNSLRMKTGIPLQRGDSYVPFVNFVSIFSPSKVKATSPPPRLRIYSHTLFSSCFSLRRLRGMLSSFLQSD